MEIIFSLDTIGQAAQQVLEQYSKARIFALTGPMGAGKTTFTLALCRALGVQDVVGSPTFAIINQYTTGNGQPVQHMDLYRLKDAAEAMGAGVEDALYSGSYCFVEWPERAPELLPPGTIWLRLAVLNETERRLTVD